MKRNPAIEIVLWLVMAVSAVGAVIVMVTPVNVNPSTSCGAPYMYFSDRNLQLLCGSQLMPMLGLAAVLVLVAVIAAVTAGVLLRKRHTGATP